MSARKKGTHSLSLDPQSPVAKHYVFWCTTLITRALLPFEGPKNHKMTHKTKMRSLTLILASGCTMNAVEALAAAASRLFGGSSGGFGGGGCGVNTSKRKKQNSRNKKQHQQQQLLPSYLPDTSATAQNLVSFCNNVLEFEGMDEGDGGGTEIGICTKSQMRGLYSTDSFSPGEFILAIPFLACLTLAQDDMMTKDEANDAELGYRLLQRINNDNNAALPAQSWNPYFQSLPCIKKEQTHFDATPDFFMLDEIQALECPILIQKALDRKQQVQQLVAHLEERSGSMDNNRFVVDVHQLQFATWLVKSRGFTLLKPVRLNGSTNTETSAVDDDDDDSSLSKVAMTNKEEGATTILLSKTVLMPYMDMINHSNNPNCQLVVVETKAEEESFYALQALRPIAKGKEITISYGVGGKQQQQQDCGYSTMIELFANYGFISPPPPPKANLAQRDLNDNDDGLFAWTTTLNEDEQLLNELETTAGQEIPFKSNMRKVLEFRIHMKRAQQQQRHSK